MITQNDIENGFQSLIEEALLSSARLRHCAATDCHCGSGKKAMAKLPTWIETVTDEATARSFIKGITVMGSIAGVLIIMVPDIKREFVALMISEAAKIGGLLTEEQIQAAIDAQAIREAEAEEKSSKPANPPKPAQIPNPLAFVPGPKSIREN